MCDDVIWRTSAWCTADRWKWVRRSRVPKGRSSRIPSTWQWPVSWARASSLPANPPFPPWSSQSASLCQRLTSTVSMLSHRSSSSSLLFFVVVVFIPYTPVLFLVFFFPIQRYLSVSRKGPRDDCAHVVAPFAHPAKLRWAEKLQLHSVTLRHKMINDFFFFFKQNWKSIQFIIKGGGGGEMSRSY